MDTIENIRGRMEIIEVAVNQALAKARDAMQDGSESLAREAINWGALGCQSVEYVIGFDYDHYRVVIDEASPDCFALCQFVGDALKNDGINDVGEIATEW